MYDDDDHLKTLVVGIVGLIGMAVATGALLGLVAAVGHLVYRVLA